MERSYRILMILSLLGMLQSSCSSKKDILYFQDAEKHQEETINYQTSNIQPDDILSITVTSPLSGETALFYNRIPVGNNVNFDIEALKLQGYIVSKDGMIDFPILGEINTSGKTGPQLEKEITTLLIEGNHLKEPSVNVRLLNAKVTILGEVRLPGTFPFTEQGISVPQALGFAGDLTILGNRKDILLIRENDGVRKITHLDLTTANWFDSPFYYIKPNDVILVNPNNTKIKSAGYIGNASLVLTVASLILTSILLISR